MADTIKTKGIVLSFIKYKETSIICKIFTQKLGLQSYLVRGIRTKRSKIALYQPLTILDLVVTHKATHSLHHIAEANIYQPYFSIPFAIKKTVIVLFLSEILSKTLREEGKNEELYYFLENSFVFFDQKEENYANFHIQFILKLTTYLGIGVETGEIFFKQLGTHEVHSTHNQDLIDRLISESYDNFIPLNQHSRNLIIQQTLYFYRLHIDGFGELKSLAVLRNIF